MTARHANSLLILTLCAAPAFADVSIKHNTRIEGVGLMKFMNMSIVSETAVSKDRARTDTQMNADSRMVRMFAGKGSTEIVRLDLDTVYTLEPDKKRYSEISLAQQRAEIEKAMADARTAQAGQPQNPAGLDESNCEWSEPETEVIRYDDRETVAGFSAERLTITASQSCTDRKNPAQVCRYRLAMDQWLSPEMPGGEELLDYYRAYSERLGFDVSRSRDFAQRAESMFSGYQDIWQEVVAQMQEVNGYPVKSSFALAIGGPQCGMADQPSLGEVETPSVGQSVGRAVGGSIGGAIGGLFGRKKKEAEEAAPVETKPEQVTTVDGLQPFLTISSELISASTGSVSADQFTVPAGYRKSN